MKLTKEDVAELGWEFVGIATESGWGMKLDTYTINHSDSKQGVMDGYESEWLLLLPSWASYGTYDTVPNVTIRLHQSGGFAGATTDEQVFKGVCKNKEELQQVMKMLRIKRHENK